MMKRLVRVPASHLKAAVISSALPDGSYNKHLLCRLLFPELPEEGGLIPDVNAAVPEQSEADLSGAPVLVPQPG